MFDFAPVGLCLTVVGLLFVSFAWRLLPRDRVGQASLGDAIGSAPYATEATVPESWPEGRATVSDLKLGLGGVVLSALLSKGRRVRPLADAKVSSGDVLLLQGSPEDLDRLFAPPAP